MKKVELFKEKVIKALLEKRKNFGGSDKAFARSMEINPSVFNRIKNGERERLLPDSKFLSLGRELGVTLNDYHWNTAETAVFKQIRQDILFCKQQSACMIFVDNCGIGKTHTAKYLANSEHNVFYIDCTQCRTETELIRALARVVGLDVRGREKIREIKQNTKDFFTLLESPIVILDEAGALSKAGWELVHEYWNGTEKFCGWYMMGANAFRNKISRGVAKDKDSFAEIFSRYSEKYQSIVPVGKDDKREFYKKLIADVLGANIKDKSKLNALVKQCLIENDGMVSGLRRAEMLLKLHNA